MRAPVYKDSPHWHGVRQPDNADSWTKWCVIPNPGIVPLAQNPEHFEKRIWDMLGDMAYWFCARYNGPGKAFQEEPHIRITKRRILIKAFGGLDV